MKKIGILVTAIILSSCGTEPALEVPEAAKSAFANQYPGATALEWEKEGNNYEVEFKDNEENKSLLYTADGELVLIKTEIPMDALPSAAVDFIASEFPNAEFGEAEKVERGNNRYFEVELYEGEKEIELYFDRQGIRVNPEIED